MIEFADGVIQRLSLRLFVEGASIQASVRLEGVSAPGNNLGCFLPPGILHTWFKTQGCVAFRGIKSGGRDPN